MSGLTIDIVYDSSVEDAPAGFKATVAAAVGYLESLSSTAITVTIDVGYDEVDGVPLGSDNLGESRSFGSDFTYAQVRAAMLARHATANEVIAASTLPTTNPTGDGIFYVADAEADALGLSPDLPGLVVGAIGLSDTAAFTWGTTNAAAPDTYDAFGVVEHEITEVLGRTEDLGSGFLGDVYTPLDLFRYAAAGVRALTPGTGYFSINGTNLLSEFNDSAINGGDAGDWASSVTDDSFDAFAERGVANGLSTTDLAVMDVLGYTPVPTDPVILGMVSDQSLNDELTLEPFADVTFTDANYQASETVTIQLSTPSNGTLSNLGAGDYIVTSGLYVIFGSAAVVTASIDHLVFDPTIGQAPGQTVATSFTITDTSSSGTSATNSVSSVAVADITEFRTTSSAGYTVADDDGTLYLAGNGSDSDVTGVQVLEFTDGISVFDPTGTAEDIARLYGAALDRAPDVAGLEYWTSQVDDSNVPLVDVATDFTNSPEFISDYGSLDNMQFVQQLYQNVLDRAADPTGLAYWTGLLNTGTSRGAVLVGFAESQEYEADTQSLSTGNTMFAAGDQDNGEIYRLYEATLDRAPDPTGQAYWVAALQSGTSLTQIAASFIGSTEFQDDYGSLTPTEFVTQLYSNVLGRAPDTAGLNDWVGVINAGGSEASVVLGFSDSTEFRADTAAATHANWVFIPT